MSVTVERLLVEVQADVRQALRGLDQVERKTATTASRGAKMARSLGMAFGAAAVIGGIKKVANLAMDFDATMRQIGVQTDQTGVKLKNMSDLALKMGQDTVFSAQDAAGAMLELAKGGLTAAQIKAGALRETLTLAAAGGLELSSAATYVTQGMNTFGLGAAKANQIVTALAGGANASTASVESMGMALSQAGAGAVNAGMSIQETVAALAAFDNAGIKGSDAGTSLKTMLSSLVPATKKARNEMREYGLEFVKRNGDFKSMSQVAQELQDGLGKLSRAERVAALRTIFGSDATRAATVLMNEGRKGLGKYLKATNDTAKAQEMANATMDGAKGAWENFKGSVETAAIKLGTKALPALTKLANGGADLIAEASTWGPAFEENFGWMTDAIKSLKGPMVDAGELVGKLAGFIGDLPQPVREMGVQAAIAALILPRLTAGVASVTGAVTANVAKLTLWRAEMTAATTASARLATVTSRLSGAFKTAAGIGGMVALTQGAKESNKALGALETVAGGAALGFSVGGPWGAVAGTLGGVALATDRIVSSSFDAKAAAEHLGTSFGGVRQDAQDYASTLDSLTGAITKQTKASIIQRASEEEILGLAQRLGVNNRDLVGTVLGNEAATRRLIQATRLHSAALEGNEQAKWNEWLNKNSGDLAHQVEATREARQAMMSWKEALGGIPKDVRTKVMQIGTDITMKQIRNLEKKYGDLSKKQVRTIITAVGTETAIRKVKGVWTVFKDGEKIKPNLNRWLAGYAGAMADGKQIARKGTGDISQLLTVETRKIKADMEPWKRSIRDAATASVAEGRTGARAVGAAMKAGVMAGFAGTQAELSAQAVAAVRGAIAAARNAGDIKSPSRKMAYIGRMLGKGMEEGLKERRTKIKERAKDLVREVMDAFRSGERDARKLLAKVSKLGADALTGKKEDAFLDRVRKTNRKLAGLYDRRANIARKFADAQKLLESRRNTKSEFVQSATQGMAQQATVLNAGNTAGHIAASLTAQVAKVKRFAQLLLKLKKMKYSEAIISQVAGAGVEGGMQAAEALAAASGAERTSIVQSFATIQATAAKTAKALGSSLYDAGISAAEGLVAGLKKRRKQIEQTIMDIAMAMQKALKKALGIKSPSRVFAKLGSFTGQGMVKGLLAEEQNVAKASARLGLAATYASTKGLTPANLSGGLRAGAGVSFSFTTVNPQAEPESRTVNKALSRVASLGLV